MFNFLLPHVLVLFIGQFMGVPFGNGKDWFNKSSLIKLKGFNFCFIPRKL